ncbi:L-seryl-tRNA(Sec) kinase [Malaya genurostris]|uniref:L-seryl-tRNA(Sec) kinase n=1 Tax=Malaya genurostris TaxID=325434 RepID=UPI0026F3933A|nr:L-seryl-tRNA(Sec) kinase [Malaya genurostris]
MSEVCINVLIGLPGAGKTTFCQNFRNYLQQKQSSITVVHVCFDDFIKLGNFDYGNSYKLKRKQFLECFELVLRAVRTRSDKCLYQANEKFIKTFGKDLAIELNSTSTLKTTYLFILDDNMYYRSMRYEILKLARKNRTGYFQIYFDIPLEDAMTRNVTRSTPIPDDVILRMNIRLEKPNGHFYRWERNCISTKDPLLDLDKIELMVIDRINHHESQLDCKIVAPVVEQSIVHKLDLLMRKTISEIIRNTKNGSSQELLKLLSNELNSKRKTLLNNFRAGLVEIPDPDNINIQHIRMLFQ